MCSENVYTCVNVLATLPWKPMQTFAILMQPSGKSNVSFSDVKSVTESLFLSEENIRKEKPIL